MSVRVAIGDFSRMTQLSVKALRHYHDVGVLVPAMVDPDSGYASMTLRRCQWRRSSAGSAIRLALTNIAMIAVGWGVFTWIVPPYVSGEIGAGPRVIGLMLTANAITVVVAQLPMARLAEGRRRAVTMAIAALTFVLACFLVVSAGNLGRTYAYPALLAAAILIGVGECFYTTVLMPLVADLAPAALRGRYMATIGLSWWLGLALAPTLGTQVLSVSPPAAMLGAAGVALAAGLSALALEGALPTTTRLTPRPAARGRD
ncbi:MAG TPA: MFS transporter [Actinomycetes bacterium]|nr:MFS transporter [Actinomycetes bacterium]